MTLLQKLYNDGYYSKQSLYKQAKKLNPEITQKQVSLFFDNNITAQQLQKVKKRVNLPIIGSIGSYQLDLIFYNDYTEQNNGFNTALIMVNMNSRYAYGRCLKGKSQNVVNAAMNKIIEQAKQEDREIKLLESDNGKEFMSNSFQKILKDNEIEHRTSQPGDHFFLGLIDRFCRTIKSLITTWMTNTDSVQWSKAFPKLLQIYNSNEHRTIAQAPKDVSKSDELKINVASKDKFRKLLKKMPDIKIGDFVRIPNTRAQFQKESPSYSKNIYTVNDVRISKVEVKNIHGAILKTKYNIFQVLKVNEKPIEHPITTIEKAKKSAKVDRRINLEGITVSDIIPKKKRTSAVISSLLNSDLADMR